MNNQKPKLLLDWTTYEAAKYACKNWHYSKCMPVGKLVKIGVWENNKFIGTVIYSYGANPKIGSPYSLEQKEICELTRVALTKHITPVSKIISISIKLIKKNFSGIKMIVSYADMEQNHYGRIYQAGNWIYVGTVNDKALILKGKKMHRRSASKKYGTRSIEFLKKIDKQAKYIDSEDKHKYLMPLDEEIRKKIQKLSKPYPKCAPSKENVAIADQAIEDGVNPIGALHL